ISPVRTFDGERPRPRFEDFTDPTLMFEVKPVRPSPYIGSRATELLDLWQRLMAPDVPGASADPWKDINEVLEASARRDLHDRVAYDDKAKGQSKIAPPADGYETRVVAVPR